MKLIFDNIIFSLQKTGGISVVWYELIKRAIEDSEIQTKFIESKNHNLFRKFLNIPNSSLIKNSFDFIPINIQRYLNPIKVEPNGIFHSSYYRTAHNSKIINVTTVHDFTYEYFRKGFPKWLHSLQKANAIKNSKRVICVSENTKKDLLKFNPNTEPTKIHVIYNGVNEVYQVIKNADKNLKNLIPFSKNEYSLFVGDRKSGYKNFIIAVKACRKVKIPLVLVGGGMLNYTESSFLTHELGANNFIHLKGLENSQLNILYNNAFCLLYPSFYEGFGIPVIEAQKAGCPVIAVNISSIPEVIGPVSTLLENPTVENIAEMMNQLKDDSDFTNTQIKIGLKNSSRFSWDKCYQETKQVYKQLYAEYF
jgi:glycosyltransferase involved in cell wall biosynthesis